MNTINTRKKFFPNVTDEEWNDWTWQVKNRIEKNWWLKEICWIKCRRRRGSCKNSWNFKNGNHSILFLFNRYEQWQMSNKKTSYSYYTRNTSIWCWLIRPSTWRWRLSSTRTNSQISWQSFTSNNRYVLYVL